MPYIIALRAFLLSKTVKLEIIAYFIDYVNNYLETSTNIRIPFCLFIFNLNFMKAESDVILASLSIVFYSLYFCFFLSVYLLSLISYCDISGSVNIESSTLSNSYSLSEVVSCVLIFTHKPVSLSI